MLKMPEEKEIILKHSTKNKNVFEIFSEIYLFERMDWNKFYLKEKLTSDTNIEQYYIEAFKDIKHKPNKESIDTIKLYLHEQKEQLIENKKYNKEFAHIIKFGDLIMDLQNLLNENMYVVNKNNIYTMLHNDDLIEFEIEADIRWGHITFNIKLNKTRICELFFVKGKDVNIKYLAPNFTFNSLISFVSNSIDILNIRNQKIEVKRNEFKNEIKNFYNEEKMENLIKRIKENV